jgi:quaternary ammonium compound-resistance protein SugE
MGLPLQATDSPSLEGKGQGIGKTENILQLISEEESHMSKNSMVIMNLIIWAGIIVIVILGNVLTSVQNSVFGACMGFLSVGIVSAGLASAGIFSIGIYSAGLYSIGIFSSGVFSVGVFSFGTYSIGIWSMGQYPVGIFKNQLK